MTCDGKMEGEKTFNVSEIALWNYLGRTLSFLQLVVFLFRARLYPHLTALSGRGEVSGVPKPRLGQWCVSVRYVELAYCLIQGTS